MRSYHIAACLFLGIFAITSPASAQTPAQQAQIQAIIAADGDNSAKLAADIAAAVAADPSLAAAVVAAAANADPTQQAAMGTGLQQAIQAIVTADGDNSAKLAADLAAAVEADPSLAAVVVAAAANADPTQQVAMGTGLANAQNFFASQGNTGAVAQIQAAVANGPATLLASYNASEINPTAGGGVGTNLAGLISSGGLNNSSSSCVSPSRPGPC